MDEESFLGFSDFYNDFPLYIDNPKIEFEKFDIDEKTSVDIDISLDRAFDFIRHYSQDLGWSNNLEPSLISGTLYHGDTFGNYIIDAITDHNEFTNNIFSLIDDSNDELNLNVLFGVLYGLRRKAPADYIYFLEKGIKNNKFLYPATSFFNILEKASKVFILEESLRSREKYLFSNYSTN